MTEDTQLLIPKEVDPKDVWYSKDKLLSYNSLFYFALGARGTGKTFAFKKWAITKDSQTVWVRRYQEDIDDLQNKFLTDLFAEGVLNPEDAELYKIEDEILYIDGVPKIYFVPLSVSGRKKSQSYHGVNEIIFDEAFEGVGRRSYLKDEVWLFFELYETINRLRVLDNRPEVRAIFISNKTSWVNPYFAELGITPFTERFKTFKDGLVVVENYSNKTFEKLKKQTPFGRLVDGTTYGGYAIDNKVWLDNDACLASRPEGARERVGLNYNGTYIGVWVKNGIAYCSKANNHTKVMTFCIRYQGADNEKPLVRNQYPLKDLIELYNTNRLRFEDNNIKQMVFSLMQSGGVQ